MDYYIIIRVQNSNFDFSIDDVDRDIEIDNGAEGIMIGFILFGNNLILEYSFHTDRQCITCTCNSKLSFCPFDSAHSNQIGAFVTEIRGLV